MTKQTTRARRQKREQTQKRSRRLGIVIVVGIIAILIAVLAIVSSRPAEAPIPEGVLERYAELDKGTTIDGYPQLGDTDAPVRIIEYASFSCPDCGTFHTDVFPRILEHIMDGEVVFTYVPLRVQAGSVLNPEGAAKSALCAGEQRQFWEFHDILYSWQPQFNSPYTQSRLLAAVDALDINRDTFNSCFRSERISDVLSAALQEDITGILPVLEVNGVEVEELTLSAVELRIQEALESVRGSETDTPESVSETIGITGTVELEATATSEPEVEVTATNEPTDEPTATPEPIEEEANATAEPSS